MCNSWLYFKKVIQGKFFYKNGTTNLEQKVAYILLIYQTSSLYNKNIRLYLVGIKKFQNKI